MSTIIITITIITFWVHETVELACVLQTRDLLFLEIGWITGRSVMYVWWAVIGNKGWGWGGDGGNRHCAHSGRNYGRGIGDGDGWCLGKVHGPQGVMMNLNSFSQSLGVPAITLTRHVAALSTAETTETSVVEQEHWHIISYFWHFITIWNLDSMAENSRAVNEQTCHVLCPQDGSEHGRPQDERSRLAQGSRLSECSAHKCGKAGRLESAARRLWNDCRPIKHSNETVCWFPEKGDRKNKERKHTIYAVETVDYVAIFFCWNALACMSTILRVVPGCLHGCTDRSQIQRDE